MCFPSSSSDSSPLLNASNSERMFDTMALEIERLLIRVSLKKISTPVKQQEWKTMLILNHYPVDFGCNCFTKLGTVQEALWLREAVGLIWPKI